MGTRIYRSNKTLRHTIIGTGLFGIALVIIGLLLTQLLLGWATIISRVLSVGLVIVVPLFWAVSSLLLMKKWNKTFFEYDNSSLSVHTLHFFGGNDVTMYRYESIMSVSLRQDRRGARYDYGDIIINIPRSDAPIVLRHVDAPEQHVRAIKAHIQANSTVTLKPSLA
jgi:hypothetical protein